MKRTIHKKELGLTLVETMLAMFLVALAMGMAGQLFHRSFEVLRVLDDKERARQASRMGLDRITSELREATEIRQTSGYLEFEKIDPTQTIVEPPLEPVDTDDIPPNWQPPDWTPQNAYPATRRLHVRYRTDGETLIREVRQASGGGWVSQIVVEGVNAFNCTPNPDNEGEMDVEVTVLDNRRAITLRSRILCPCIRQEYDPS